MSHKRKSPIRHGVKTHVRKGKEVNRFERGSGNKSRTIQTTGSSLSILKAKQKEFTIDEHRRKLKKIGDKISYLDNGKRVSGDVVGIRAEYYLVERNGKVWKVDRHSIFTRIGDALKGAGAKLLTAGKEGLAGAAKLTEEGIARRISERRNWNEHKKEIEQEEKLVFEREKIKIRREEERRKFRAKIRAGPNWKKALKVGRILVKQESKKTQRKAFDSLVGKKQSKDIINAIARAKREAEGKKIKSKRRVKKRKTKAKPTGKTITIRLD